RSGLRGSTAMAVEHARVVPMAIARQAMRFCSCRVFIRDRVLSGVFGIGESGGLRGAFRKQVQALSACRMTLGFNANGRAHTYEGKPIKHFDAWLSGKEEQRPLWPGTVSFFDDYYQTLKLHAVPLDIRAYMELKGSALAMDIYIWAAQRLHRIEGRPIVLYWSNLRDQFGQDTPAQRPTGISRRSFCPHCVPCSPSIQRHASSRLRAASCS
ncbi:MAG TPA: replication protein RepA, partial [Xylella sp.]